MKSQQQHLSLDKWFSVTQDNIDVYTAVFKSEETVREEVLVLPCLEQGGRWPSSVVAAPARAMETNAGGK